jgi:2-phospho-L-lactate guanylyltransferase (CobY/MobA/RfbA family)
MVEALVDTRVSAVLSVSTRCAQYYSMLHEAVAAVATRVNISLTAHVVLASNCASVAVSIAVDLQHTTNVRLCATACIMLSLTCLTHE